MSDMTLARIRELNKNRTPGEWEAGYWYHVQGADYCLCRPEHGPLINDAKQYINGRLMPTHVHRRETPAWEEGIRTKDNNGGVEVVPEVSEYGLIDPADREFIANAPAMIEYLLGIVDEIRAIHQPGPPQLMVSCDAVPDIMGEISLCLGCNKEWPCPTIQAIGQDK